jgi:hypothetical protein
MRDRRVGVSSTPIHLTRNNCRRVYQADLRAHYEGSCHCGSIEEILEIDGGPQCKFALQTQEMYAGAVQSRSSPLTLAEPPEDLTPKPS